MASERFAEVVSNKKTLLVASCELISKSIINSLPVSFKQRIPQVIDLAGLNFDGY
jgi:hypothetical protein